MRSVILMDAITDETRLLCRNHIDTAEQLLSYKGSLESEMQDTVHSDLRLLFGKTLEFDRIGIFLNAFRYPFIGIIIAELVEPLRSLNPSEYGVSA